MAILVWLLLLNSQLVSSQYYGYNQVQPILPQPRPTQPPASQSFYSSGHDDNTRLAQDVLDLQQLVQVIVSNMDSVKEAYASCDGSQILGGVQHVLDHVLQKVFSAVSTVKQMKSSGLVPGYIHGNSAKSTGDALKVTLDATMRAQCTAPSTVGHHVGHHVGHRVCGYGSSAYQQASVMVYSCLRFYPETEKLEQAAAKVRCQHDGGRLFIMNSEERRQLVKNFFTSQGITDARMVWVDANDVAHEGVYRWGDGDTLSPSSDLWSKGEPNNKRKKEDCVAVNGRAEIDFHLSDLPCGAYAAFLCEIP